MEMVVWIGQRTITVVYSTTEEFSFPDYIPSSRD